MLSLENKKNTIIFEFGSGNHDFQKPIFFDLNYLNFVEVEENMHIYFHH